MGKRQRTTIVRCAYPDRKDPTEWILAMSAHNDVSHNTPLDLFNLSHNSNRGPFSEELDLSNKKMPHLLLLSCLSLSAFGFLLEEPSYRDSRLADKNVHNFTFVLTWEQSMLYTDKDGVQWNVDMEKGGHLFASPNGTKRLLQPKDVATLDGYQTKYIAINGQMPGPTIEVPIGATVFVKVQNNLLTDSATIHWHGLTQRNTQWSDGAPYISQCPIPPHTSFTYKFVAEHAGTFWYHSHLDMQRMDGLFGALIVHDMSRPSFPSFTVQVHDWLHMDSDQFATDLYGPGEETAVYNPIPDRYDDLAEEDVGDLKSDSFLINGRGRFNNNSAPLTVHKVTSRQQYLFRFINTGFDNMIEVSIDDHKMTVVGTDSSEVEPTRVNSVFLAIGERVNVLVTASQSAGNYWVRYRAPHKNQTPLGKSILSYDGIAQDPTSQAKTCREDSPCVALNCPFSRAPGWRCIPISSLRSTSYHSGELALIRGNKISEHFLAYSYMAGDSISGRTMSFPTSPFYQTDYRTAGVACNDTVCNARGCSCTHVKSLPENGIVQIIIMHHVLKHFIHTWHMHGYRFAVLKVVYPPKDYKSGLIMSTLNRDIACSNDFCHDARWINSTLGDVAVDRPPLKDTVLIPVGGYAIIRVFTDNPGYWMAHCHQAEHLHEGMAMVLDVNGKSIQVPKGFPTCGNFIL
ncbi:uncharacterized protein [Watersipora subatra]|uniref:uncharacterized protein n=1 Tax=Watersipora subatra TaxID=2589382 RepID=UPI00355B6E55